MRKVKALSIRVGVDIGGTFTDLVALRPSGAVATLKIPSTPQDYGLGIIDGLRKLSDAAGFSPGDIGDIVHATTVATNTVLEQKGARTGLVTTAGFRDILELKRLRIPVLYDLQYVKPLPMVPRHLRFEVEERLGPDGSVWRPLQEDSAQKIADQLAAADVEAVAICLLHSYANAEHELKLEEIIRERLGGDVYIARSSSILPEIREYERTSTTVVSAYVGPTVATYLDRLGASLRAADIRVPLRVVQSNGGAMSRQNAVRSPAHLLESGPAAGVIACARAASELGLDRVISLDMGGTTAKAAMIEGGKPARTTEYEVGAGINLSSKLVKGGGYAVNLPFIDVSEIGAGGGSVVSIGNEGTINVGPRSAGAVPGPACYQKGGLEPTFTDAVVALGYLNQTALAGGQLPIDASLAREAIRNHVADPLGKPAMEAAFGVFSLAAATMTRAVKAVTTFRGRDPREFTLFAFGGNGPVAAFAVARELGIQTVMVPPAPGVFSAFGLPLADIEHEMTRSMVTPCVPANSDKIYSVALELKQRGALALEADGFRPDDMEFTHLVDMRYVGQAFELTVEVPANAINVDAALDAFHAEHDRTYGHHSPDDMVEIINLRVVARGKHQSSNGGSLVHKSSPSQSGVQRTAFFGQQGMHDVPVVAREDLSSSFAGGPLIIEEYDSTCVVPPEASVRVDQRGNIEMRIDQ